MNNNLDKLDILMLGIFNYLVIGTLFAIGYLSNIIGSVELSLWERATGVFEIALFWPAIIGEGLSRILAKL